MTTIPEDMDEFVNWEAAAAEVGNIFNMSSQDVAVPPTDPNLDLDLVLENADDDDFGFFALEHFSGGPAPGIQATDNPVDLVHDSQLTSAQEDWWYTPDAPCDSCILGGYQCKKIKEAGSSVYEHYCTSCVALRSECSFAKHLPATARLGPLEPLPSSNPWPTMGDHPRSVREDSGIADLLHSHNSWPAMGDPPGSARDDGAMLAGLPATSTPDLLRSLTASASADEPAAAVPPTKTTTSAKIGARFSRESVRILKNWLSTHTRHPYPSDEEKEMLQRQTGLNKTQITNWLANARRRGKTQAPRSTSPHPRSYSGAIDIPQRRGTPAPDGRVRHMNPLERWVDSPPENEPAEVTAIARAVASSSGASSSGLTSPYSFNFTDDGSGRSLCNASSASSLGTSHSSGGSFASAYSHASRGSFGSFGSFNRGRRRRRRRAGANPVDEKTSLAPASKTFQCTFCTETFRTKHDWQRHEKSLHLSLERWVCSPDGPVALNPETNQLCCVFCGEANPDQAHTEKHNHSQCQERSLEERTFYRKDHLNQHLRLVHDTKFSEWSMKSWKVATPEIRSRCGFCGCVLDSWKQRTEHLSEHFKGGTTMADWKGDWGFEAPVLEMVENSIPPYLIDNERNSPYPYQASGAPAETPRSAYELIKVELAHFMQNHYDKYHTLPSDEQMQLESCRIIFASEVLSIREISYPFSWLRDLLMGDDDLMRQAKIGKMRSQAENRLSTLKLNGKDTLFERCPLEEQLHEFVRAKRLLGLTAMDEELQTESCNIVGRIEEVSTAPSDFIASWLVRCINRSTNWLANFRQRAHLPRTEDIVVENERSTDATKIDSTIHNYSRLERSLADYLERQRSMGIEPCNDSLQREARIIIYEFDDGWNQTAADNLDWLAAFRHRHPSASVQASSLTTTPASQSQLSQGGIQQAISETSPSNVSSANASKSLACPFLTDETADDYGARDQAPPSLTQTGPFFLNDANCFRRLMRELARWTSKYPPESITDEMLQRQARVILYNDDDPWNQTAADNAEWLLRFKRDCGLIRDPGPGLPPGDAWSLAQGGTGFAPPYAFPKGAMAPFSEKTTDVPIRNVKVFEIQSDITNRYLETFKTRYPKPATIFCSRELEDGLVKFVETEMALSGQFPDDDSLRAHASFILNAPETAANDSALLGKFKGWMMTRGQQSGQQQKRQQQQPVLFHPQPRMPAPSASASASVPTLPTGMDLTLSDAEMNNILRDMNFDLSTADLEGLDMNMGMGFSGEAGPSS
ncbi:Putative Homeobox domain, HTH CenpB-type DNA-binding domain, Homeobox-like domain superfamily [Colletotrichum destructivum]|uniref:Homeobox domain, HTH CenpB-type DNA-binding domain, Homeobox-like domain superfamily n=1 Tax=Colletotrichum destructivum TaxID=34406 RepID=A0AAX4IJD6_9PEZI|nr:Putative Homeobox domain, HTH CenpB-type DNA-binding domain, Homeobox-like domain superfamily [Colletotrichum destructivum]